MGTVYRETYTKPLPSGAEVFTRKGERFARWTDRRGRKHTAKVTTPTDGEHADIDRVLVEARTFTAKYRDGAGHVRKTATGCRSADAALIVLAELEKRAERVRCGSLTAAEDAVLDHRTTALSTHVDAYLEHLGTKRGKGGKPRTNAAHVRNARFRLKRVIADCGFTLLRDLGRPALEKWANAREAEGMPANTLNGYLLAACAFGNWCVDTKRLTANPFARPPKRDGKADQRRPRRALTEDELRRLLTVARLRPLAEYGRPTVKLADAGKRENNRSRRTWKRAPLTLSTLGAAEAHARDVLAKRPDFIAELERRGRERALIYKALLLTGLRKGELASLTVAQLELDGRVAYAVLAAADEKAGRGAEIPLRSDLVADLNAWLGERLDAARAAAKAKGLPLPARLPDDTPLFHVPADLVRAFDRDLEVADIPKRDDRGRVLDVHSLRHTFGTHLSKGGVTPRVAQAAMRHSTIELTMNTYTDPRLLDVAGALDALPALPPIGRPDAQRAKATGTDGRSFLVPTLVPDSGNACTNGSQAGTSGDDRPSGRAAVSATMDADWKAAGAGSQALAEQGDKATAGDRLADCLAELASSAPDLAAVVTAWPTLPEPVRAGVVATVQASAPTPPSAGRPHRRMIGNPSPTVGRRVDVPTASCHGPTQPSPAWVLSGATRPHTILPASPTWARCASRPNDSLTTFARAMHPSRASASAVG
ncbi:MAG: tyrosine-type recombinase/integrase [Phycisphaerae bacterium]|jgi:integrase